MAEEKMDPAQLQAEIDKASGGWLAGESAITQLSAEEQDIMLGYVPSSDEPSLEEREKISLANVQDFESQAVTAYGYPSSYDLRSGNFITPVKNQGGCGSCVAFGTCATIEGAYRKLYNKPNENINLSEAHLFYCIAKSQGRHCRNGWWVPPSLNATRDIGITAEACFPYTGGDQPCKLRSDCKNNLTKIGSWHDIKSTSDMKTWLSTKGPLVACYTVYSDFFSYRSGIYRHVSGAVRGGHAVSCVGYNDSQRYWIMKNSWGSSWGENGYFRIAYGQCGIDSVMWAVNSIEDTRWYTNVKVVGLWANDQTRNAWAYISGSGWKKISNENDVIFYNMLTHLASAKAANRPVRIHVEKRVIKQIYVL